jgi:hypothetical protein
MDDIKLIGITGPARAGKDTFSVYLDQALWVKEKHFSVMALATPLKKMLSGGLGLTFDQLHGKDKETVDPRYGKTPRQLMQTLGTEWGRNMVHNDIWLNIAANHGQFDTIITDIRYENEAAYVRERGVLIHIQRLSRPMISMKKILL